MLLDEFMESVMRETAAHERAEAEEREVCPLVGLHACLLFAHIDFENVCLHIHTRYILFVHMVGCALVIICLEI